MKKIFIAACAAAITLACSGRSVYITLWRGETATKILHDYARIDKAPEGFEIKIGTAREIRYLTRPFGTHYQHMADRVEWGSKEPGVKVLSVSAPTDAKPGVYWAGDLKITVVDRVLPPPGEWKYFLDLWQHPWAVARYFGVKPFSKEHYAAMRPLWEMLARSGNKTLTVTLLDKPWDNQCYDPYGTMIRRVKKRDGKWKFDYSVFDEYVKFGRSCGLGPVISCYTMCPWGYMAAWEDENGKAHVTYASNLVNNCGYLDQFPFTDDDWHTYGALWEKGRVTWYMDGVKMHSVEYKADAWPQHFYRDDPTPLPPAETVWPDNPMVKERTKFGAHSIMDTDEEVVFLTARETYAMDVDWVRIWRV